MRLLLSCALLAGGALTVSATTLLQLGLPAMTKDSVAIVRGTVTQSSVEPRGSDLYTHYKVRVAETWKGSPGSTVDVAVPGGVYHNVRETVPGAPALTMGQDCILFLWTSKSGLTTITGLSQGVFEIVRGSDGQLMISRPVPGAVVLDASGRQIAATPVRMSLIQFRAAVAAALTGGGN